MSKRIAGLDIGSRAVKLVLVERGEPVRQAIRDTSHDPIAVCRDLLDGLGVDRIMATGYGRNLAKQYLDAETMTEIRAVSLGARRLFPACRTLLDIGGQDTKAVALDPSGAVRKFEMNDRCAAGTGRFIEVMAAALGLSMPDFVSAGQGARKGARLSSLCAVFAETETVSMVARGVPREEVVLGIHEAIARRSLSLLQRIPVEDDVVFTGGVAENPLMARLFQKGLGRRVLLPEHPQIVAALGAALEAAAHPD